MKRIAIIPARGGSKRIPKKNIKNFCGKPIIYYTIDYARKSNLFDVIHVSTDDKEIIEEITKINCVPRFFRPKNLSDDQTTLVSVLKFVVKKFERLGIKFDEVWLLMACAPLLTVKDLLNAKDFYTNTKHDCMIGVSEYSAPIEWAFELDYSNKLIPVNPGMFKKSSREFTPKFFDTGSFAVFKTDILLSLNESGSDDIFCGYKLPRIKAVDIDNILDWKFAEEIYQLLKLKRDINENCSNN